MKKPSERLAARVGAPGAEEVQTRKEQYDLLRPYYVEETDRYEALNKRAAAYLSVVGAISIFAAFKTDFIAQSILMAPALVALSIAALVSLLLCVLAVAYSMRITEYKSPISPRELVLAADLEKYTSDDSYSVLLAGLVDSTEWNRVQNDKRANALKVSLWFAALAVGLAIATNVTLAYRSYKEPKVSTDNQTNSSAPAPAPSASSPAASSPSKTSMADLLNTTQTVPLKKSDDVPPRRPPSVGSK